ncbi:hypothetical protein YPPY66_1117, partial [Yersinia pestis PY-66]
MHVFFVKEITGYTYVFRINITCYLGSTSADGNIFKYSHY